MGARISRNGTYACFFAALCWVNRGRRRGFLAMECASVRHACVHGLVNADFKELCSLSTQKWRLWNSLVSNYFQNICSCLSLWENVYVWICRKMHIWKNVRLVTVSNYMEEIFITWRLVTWRRDIFLSVNKFVRGSVWSERRRLEQCKQLVVIKVQHFRHSSVSMRALKVFIRSYG